MQEKVLLEVIPGISFAGEAEELSRSECKLSEFAYAHRYEIYSIISDLPSSAVSEAKFEYPYQR